MTVVQLFKRAGLVLACLSLATLSCGGNSGGNSAQYASAKLILADDIQEITCERIFGCEGRCPVYEVVLRKDGTASYEGTRYAERKGKYHATGANYYFNRLATLMTNSRFRDFQNVYGPGGIDEGLVITSVTDSAGRKTVTDHGSHGPIELWGIEMAIEGSLSQIDWQRDR